MDNLRHLQLVILSIVKDIDELCRKNHIDYYLNGGSAIGAVRHKGFIPWDDDLDIMMMHKDYDRFIKCCREQLDPEKYYVQEGLKDWPLNYSKIKLRHTHFEEMEDNSGNSSETGIFVDIFPIDNTTHNHWMQRWQYACAKYRVCYGHLQRKYKTASWQKKVLIAMAWPMKIGCVRRFVIRQSERYNDRETELVGAFYGTSRLSHCVYRRTTFGTPCRLPFENTTLPVAGDYDDYLTVTFGDYMTPPPVEQQVCQHNTSIDFGPY